MLCPHQCRLIEGLCELHQISSIFGTCRLIRGMHRKLSHSDIHACHRDKRVQNCAKRASARNVGVVCEYLARYAGLLAEHLCYCLGNGIRCIFLVCALFNDNAPIHVYAALRIVFLRMCRVEGMCIVSRNKEASRKISVICNRVFSTGCIDMLQCLCQERRIRTLLCEASYLLIVKDCADIDLACCLCSKKAL